MTKLSIHRTQQQLAVLAKDWPETEMGELAIQLLATMQRETKLRKALNALVIMIEENQNVGNAELKAAYDALTSEYPAESAKP